MTEKAFPVSHDCGHDQGMTLRDYFAAKAMQGFASADINGSDFGSLTELAQTAYWWADAMLKARK